MWGYFRQNGIHLEKRANVLLSRNPNIRHSNNTSLIKYYPGPINWSTSEWPCTVSSASQVARCIEAQPSSMCMLHYRGTLATISAITQLGHSPVHMLDGSRHGSPVPLSAHSSCGQTVASQSLSHKSSADAAHQCSLSVFGFVWFEVLTAVHENEICRRNVLPTSSWWKGSRVSRTRLESSTSRIHAQTNLPLSSGSSAKPGSSQLHWNVHS